MRIIYLAIGAAGCAAIVSGTYLYQEGRSLWQKAQQEIMKVSNVDEPRTEVAQRAPAPATASATVPISASASASESASEMVDHVHQNAMAPTRTNEDEPQDAETTNAMLLQIKAPNASLRAGPGLEYKILGTANPNWRYIVTDWKDRWFRVLIRDPQAIDTVRTAWIRNDLVKLVSQVQQ